ncbi:hypothetical protein C8F01DRAFT_1233402 [Mycena amicta]|nr:hypothetical protein C8F01DRAFT_1233402 [Mycena amicta]
MTDVDETRANKLREDLDYLLALNPQRLEPAKTPLRPTVPPHAFYNKHIDDRLVLRRVLPLGSLVQDIADFAQKHLDYSALANADCNELPTEGFRDCLYERPDEPPVTGPETVADEYSKSVGHICGGLATKFLCPMLPKWMGIIRWARRAQPDETPTGVDDTSRLFFFQDDDRKLFLIGNLFKLVEESLLKDFERVATFAPKIGGLDLSITFGGIGRTTPRSRQDNRPAELCLPVLASSAPLPQDAASTPWTFPSSTMEITDSSYPAASSRSLRSKAAPKASASSQLSVGVVPSASRRPKTTAHVSVPLTAEALVQLAWARAVETDSTMITFNCGNYERIGIRHRETQTLYISDLFDVTSCKDPGYIKLHVGVFLSQTLDAISRMKDAQKHSSQSTRKRPNREDIAPVPNKRRRGNPKTTEPHYDIYHSRVPASFIRANPCLQHGKGCKPGKIPSIKCAYKPHECFEIILTSKLGDGAVGIVHGAMARVTTKDGETLVEENLVVKLAFRHQPQERMRYEYTVCGLFEDLEGGAIALLMSNCGTNLWQLRPDKKTARTSGTPAQCVHRAGVWHYDIRAANLMLNNAGEAFIVDFDRGRLNPSEGNKEAEMYILREAMEGLPTDYKIASLPTPGDDAEIWLATPTPTEQTPGSKDEEEDSDEADEAGKEDELAD